MKLFYFIKPFNNILKRGVKHGDRKSNQRALSSLKWNKVFFFFYKIKKIILHFLNKYN